MVGIRVNRALLPQVAESALAKLIKMAGGKISTQLIHSDLQGSGVVTAEDHSSECSRRLQRRRQHPNREPKAKIGSLNPLRGPVVTFGQQPISARTLAGRPLPLLQRFENAVQIKATRLLPRRELLKGCEKLTYNGGSWSKHIHPLGSPNAIANGLVIGAFEGIPAKVQQLGKAQRNERLLPNVKTVRPVAQKTSFSTAHSAALKAGRHQ